MQITVPDHVLALLWDVKIQNPLPPEHYSFVIERILELGDVKQVKWMQKVFTKQQIVDTLTVSKRISVKSGNFYAVLYNLPRENLECFRAPFTQKQLRF